MALGEPTKSTERFSNRVGDYIKYRPGYPPEVIGWLRSQLAMTPTWTVVDVGAGTGISSKLFLDAGNTVIAIEPNAAMRQASEERLVEYKAFRAKEGTAEATTLPSGGADLIVSAQAFHWFDHDLVRVEWRRILKSGGFAAVFWNTRRLRGSRFLAGYEAILSRYCAEYQNVAERYPDDEYMHRWFGPGFVGAASFENVQHLDLEGIIGRLMSSSYAPKSGHPAHQPMITALAKLFTETSVAGRVDISYDTRIFVGSL